MQSDNMPVFGKRRIDATGDIQNSPDTGFGRPSMRSDVANYSTLPFVALIGVGFSIAFGAALIVAHADYVAIATSGPPAPVTFVYVPDGASTKAVASAGHANRVLTSQCEQRAARVRLDMHDVAQGAGSVPEIEKAIIECHLAIQSTDLCEPLLRWRLGRRTAAYLDEYSDGAFLSRLKVAKDPSPLTTAQSVPADVRVRLRELYSYGLLGEQDLKTSGRPDGVREAFRLIVAGTSVRPMKCPNPNL